MTTPSEAERSRDHHTLSRLFRRQEKVVLREVAGEVILVPVSGKLAELRQIHVLGPVSALIWRLLNGRNDLDAVLVGVVDEFDVTRDEAETDLLEFIAELEGAGLIIEKAEPGP